MTLPSHATIMSGLYPPANGVRDNGAFRFDRTPSTLASTLASAGYRTAAFIGSFVLDARFGLNAGFGVYDDRLNGSSANLEIVQRTAEQVLAPAYEWITSDPHPAPSPWLVWVHLYDPHEPYTPPEPYRSRYAADPYAGEIAYADASARSVPGSPARRCTHSSIRSWSSRPTMASRWASTASAPMASLPTNRRCACR